MKDFFLGLLSTLVAILVLFLAGEASIRAWHFYKNTFSGQMNPKVIALDDVQGWLPVKNYRYRGELLDAGGERYPVDIGTNADGYRTFGDMQPGDRKKVLFLGDSFTHAMQVSDDKTYYGLLQEALGIEAFAFGVDGYGTLQEYLLLNSIMDDLRPDIVVLQFCPNDFINNLYDLELQSAHNNNGLRRPYLVDGEVVYKTPASFPAQREFAARFSEFLYFIIKKIDLLNEPPVNPAEKLIEEQGLRYALFRESVDITDEALARFRARIPPDTAVYAFSTHHQYPYLDTFRTLAEKNGIRFIDGTSQAVAAAEAAGVTTRAADGAHWNNAGHRAIANVLRDYFENNP
jgi:lysophospholipase L1-like esterase